MQKLKRHPSEYGKAERHSRESCAECGLGAGTGTTVSGLFGPHPTQFPGSNICDSEVTSNSHGCVLPSDTVLVFERTSTLLSVDWYWSAVVQSRNPECSLSNSKTQACHDRPFRRVYWCHTNQLQKNKLFCMLKLALTQLRSRNARRQNWSVRDWCFLTYPARVSRGRFERLCASSVDTCCRCASRRFFRSSTFPGSRSNPVSFFCKSKGKHRYTASNNQGQCPSLFATW